MLTPFVLFLFIGRETRMQAPAKKKMNTHAPARILSEKYCQSFDVVDAHARVQLTIRPQFCIFTYTYSLTRAEHRAPPDHEHDGWQCASVRAACAEAQRKRARMTQLNKRAHHARARCCRHFCRGFGSSGSSSSSSCEVEKCAIMRIKLRYRTPHA